MRRLVRSALLLSALSLALWSTATRVSTQSTPQYGIEDVGTVYFDTGAVNYLWANVR